MNDPIGRVAATYMSLDDAKFWALTALVVNDDLRKFARISCPKQ